MPDTELSNRRYAAQAILAKALHRPSAKVSDLVVTLNRYSLIRDLWEIQENQDTAMRDMCRVMDWSAPESFSLLPVNSAACLIYWTALTDFCKTFSRAPGKIYVRHYGAHRPQTYQLPCLKQMMSASENLHQNQNWLQPDWLSTPISTWTAFSGPCIWN